MEFVLNEIIEKYLNFEAVTYGKIIEFWNRQRIDQIHG